MCVLGVCNLVVWQKRHRSPQSYKMSLCFSFRVRWKAITAALLWTALMGKPMSDKALHWVRMNSIVMWACNKDSLHKLINLIKVAPINTGELFQHSAISLSSRQHAMLSQCSLKLQYLTLYVRISEATKRQLNLWNALATSRSFGAIRFDLLICCFEATHFLPFTNLLQ